MKVLERNCKSSYNKENYTGKCQEIILCSCSLLIHYPYSDYPPKCGWCGRYIKVANV